MLLYIVRSISSSIPIIVLASFYFSTIKSPSEMDFSKLL